MAVSINVLGKVVVSLGVLQLNSSLAPDEFKSKCLSRIDRDLNTFVVGISKKMMSTLTTCKIGLAYLYTIEDDYLGDRIRNREIRFLANLLGLRQARSVVEALNEVSYVVVVSSNQDNVEKIMNLLQETCNASSIDFQECSTNDLYEITRNRIERLSK